MMAISSTTAAQVGQELADHRAALSAFRELIGRAEELGMPLDEGKFLVLEQFDRGKAARWCLLELGLDNRTDLAAEGPPTCADR